MTPDTILRWHRQFVARKWTFSGRPSVLPDIQRLVVRMAAENPTWGYTRLQAALKNLGHRVLFVLLALEPAEEGHDEELQRGHSVESTLIARQCFRTVRAG